MAIGDPFAISKTSRVNKGWAAIAVSAITIFAGTRIYRNYTRPNAMDLDENELIQPGAYVGESTVKRKSPYEGAGNSYMVSVLLL